MPSPYEDITDLAGLKTFIETYIKANGNRSITGEQANVVLVGLAQIIGSLPLATPSYELVNVFANFNKQFTQNTILDSILITSDTVQSFTLDIGTTDGGNDVLPDEPITTSTPRVISLNAFIPQNAYRYFKFTGLVAPIDIKFIYK